MSDNANDHEHEREQDNDKRKEVTIIFDDKPREIVAGTYTVADFKKLLGIDPSKVVELREHGKFVPLQDTDTVHVKEHEVFISHVPRGGSSWR